MVGPGLATGSAIASNKTIDLARRHVNEGRKIVAQQRIMVSILKELGRNTRDAERTLELFEQSLAIFESHLQELTAKTDELTRGEG